MDIALTRLNRLSDLIFASSMTILILMFQLPNEDEIASPELFERYIDDSLPGIYLFVITFSFIAIYWVKDVDQFKHTIKTNSSHMWLQLGSLGFLVLLPWVNALQEINPENKSVRILYCLVVILVGLFSSLAWEYASKNHRLIDPKLEKELVKDIRVNNYSEPVIALIAMFAAIFYPKAYTPVFILIPILFIAQKGIRERLRKWIEKRK